MTDREPEFGAPWTAHICTTNNIGWIENGAEQTVCDLYFVAGPRASSFVRFPNWRRNLRLIEAAPDMLAALEMVLEQGLIPPDGDIAAQVNYAVDKARWLTNG